MVAYGGSSAPPEPLSWLSTSSEPSSFTATELDREKRNVLRSYERAATERRNRPSAQLAAEYIRHYLEGEPVPGIELEHELAGRFLPEITLAEVNALARDWLPEQNRVVLLSAPEKAGVVVPTEAELARVIDAVAADALEPYVDTVDEEPLVDPLPAPGSVRSATPASAFGITEWTLSNGVKVVLKPTTFKQDEIVFRAVSPGGTSLASDADYIPAETADAVVAQGGLGDFSRIDLDKVLAGTTASVRADIGPTEEGLAGGAARAVACAGRGPPLG